MVLQKSYFTLHVPRRATLDPAQPRCKKPYKIPAGAKGHLRSQLRVLSIDDFSIYGDLDHLARALKEVLDVP